MFNIERLQAAPVRPSEPVEFSRARWCGSADELRIAADH